MHATRLALAAVAAAMISASCPAQTPNPTPAAPPTGTTPDTTAAPPPAKASTNKIDKAKAAAAEATPPIPIGAPAGSSATRQGGGAVFPTAVAAKYTSEKPGDARKHTCLDQYHANRAAKGNGGLKWIQTGGGYYSQCSKKLKAAAAS